MPGQNYPRCPRLLLFTAINEVGTCQCILGQVLVVFQAAEKICIDGCPSFNLDRNDLAPLLNQYVYFPALVIPPEVDGELLSIVSILLVKFTHHPAFEQMPAHGMQS